VATEGRATDEGEAPAIVLWEEFIARQPLEWNYDPYVIANISQGQGSHDSKARSYLALSGIDGGWSGGIVIQSFRAQYPGSRMVTPVAEVGNAFGSGCRMGLVG